MQIQATYSSAYTERDLSPLHWTAKWTKSRRENTLFVSRNEVSKVLTGPWFTAGIFHVVLCLFNNPPAQKDDDPSS